LRSSRLASKFARPTPSCQVQPAFDVDGHLLTTNERETGSTRSGARKPVRLRPLISFEGSGDLCPARNGRVDTALPAIPLAMSGLGLLPCVC